MSEVELRNGKCFCYADLYETIEVRVLHGKTLEGYGAFKIWVNDRPILISKSFVPVADRLNELKNRYGLRETRSK